MANYKEKIKAEEGVELKLYKCSGDKWTIGYGHNIEDRGISPAVADFILGEDIRIALDDVESLVDDFKALPDNIKLVLVDMSFQMGKPSLSCFKLMLKAIEVKAWDVAATELLDSLYARQTPARANRNADLMRNAETN